MKYIRATVAATAVSLGLLALPVSHAQGTAGQPIATGLNASGTAIAQVSSVARDGDRLTINVRFKPAAEGTPVSEVLYAGISEQNYERNFYLVSGDKKYLLLKDSQGVPLAPNGVTLRGKGPFVGIWNGVFPAPPAGQKATLFLVGIEPLGPFEVPAE